MAPMFRRRRRRSRTDRSFSPPSFIYPLASRPTKTRFYYNTLGPRGLLSLVWANILKPNLLQAHGLDPDIVFRDLQLILYFGPLGSLCLGARAYASVQVNTK